MTSGLSQLYQVRQLEAHELARSTLSTKLRWAVVASNCPSRIIRRYRTQAEAQAAIRSWASMVRPGAA